MSKQHFRTYPRLSLAKAIEMTGKIYSEERTNPMGRIVAARHIGYASAGRMSGPAATALGALRHYGLVENSGKDEIRVTQLAIDILFPETPENKAEAVKIAAKKPKLFQELNDRFSSVMPSVENLKTHLLRQQFADEAVKKIVAAYMGTREFLERETMEKESAHENNDDAGAAEEEEQEQEQEPETIGGTASESEEGVQSVSRPSEPEKSPPPTPDSMRYVFPFEEGEASITIPRQLSEESLEDLKDWLDLVKRKAERAVKQKAQHAAKGPSVFD